MDPESFDFSRPSSYFRELVETSRPVTPSSTLPAELRLLFGPWVSVTAAVAKASSSLAGIGAAGSVVDLVVALSGTGDDQTELLQSIKRDTELLRQGYLKDAIRQLSEAERVGPSDERWITFMKDAIDHFYSAGNRAASSGERAVACFGLGCAYLTLGYSRDAQHWIDESARSSHEFLDELDRKVSARRSKDIRQFLPFFNSVEICAAVIHGRTQAKVIAGFEAERVRVHDEMVESMYPGAKLSTREYHYIFKYFDLPARGSPDT